MDELTLAKALYLAQAYETAIKDPTTLLSHNAQQLHRANPAAVAAATQTHNNKPCYRCI